MLARVKTCATLGVDAYIVDVEVNLSTGLPAFTVVGLAQGSVREGRERVGTALRNAGYGLPSRRITVNLAPADVRKEGTGFDLPVAVGILAASGRVPLEALEDVVMIGELGLDSCIRGVRGVLPVVLGALEAGIGCVIVPPDNRGEAELVTDVDVLAPASLEEVVEALGDLVGARVRARKAREDRRTRGDARDESPREVASPRNAVSKAGESKALDLADVRGQDMARRALEVVAAGGHNLLMVGPPGSGKTMLARRLPGILPPLQSAEAVEVARVHSVAGLLARDRGLPGRPFRAPHHTVSYAGLVGGGSPARPGEISLAHHGVLFLDELPEYRRNALEVLRQPMEEGWVTLARVHGSLRFPARFLLVSAMNPCPCGYQGDGTDRCVCNAAVVTRYRGRVSGPLLDRFDLRIEVGRPPLADLHTPPRGESTAEVASRVARVREVQTRRFAGMADVFANAHVTSTQLRTHGAVRPRALAELRRYAERLHMSARAFDRTLRVARTIADLDASEDVFSRHLGEALQYRLELRAEEGL